MFALTLVSSRSRTFKSPLSLIESSNWNSVSAALKSLLESIVLIISRVFLRNYMRLSSSSRSTLSGLARSATFFSSVMKYLLIYVQVVLVQLAVPSRQDVEEYQNLRSTVNELVGRINGRFGTVEFMPIHFMHKSLAFDELCALYTVSDVCLVSSTRDGMNLVSSLLPCHRNLGMLITECRYRTSTSLASKPVKECSYSPNLPGPRRVSTDQ